MTRFWKTATVLAVLWCGLPAASHAQQVNRGKNIVEPALETEPDAKRIKQALDKILKTYPPSLTQVLQLDPLLLSNAAYLAPYPKLADFLKEYPAVTHSPAYFMGTPQEVKPAPKPTVTYVYTGGDHVSSFIVFFALICVVAWLIRAVIEHQKWLKTSRVQSETQAKILERFTSNEDLLTFIQTPAGKHFLESSATPAQPQTITAPIQQILWSVQIGLVLFMGGLGLDVASPQPKPGAENSYEILSILMMAVGLGFVFSAMSSWILSKKLGLLTATGVTSQTPPS